jgi:hypothetical protein
MPESSGFLKRSGANFLSIINDLKRNRQAAADELGVPLARVESIIAGEEPLTEDLLRKAVSVWPVNRRDFMIVEDDAPDGVLVMPAADSARTARVFQRGGADYYEYRDTAMSKTSPFRPEWILELKSVDDDEPSSPAVHWNNGHFMHQFTMFVGAVNFYYLDGTERRVMKADTGDSMYITPFVPHTFATRRKDADARYGGRKGLILALTYGNKLAGDVQHELSALGGTLPAGYLLDASSREAYAASLLRQQLESLSMSAETLAELSGVRELPQLLAARRLPTPDEYEALADALDVNSRDLMPPDAFDAKVATKVRAKTAPRCFGAYTVTDLAAVRYLPYSKAVILEREGAADVPDLRLPLHQYVYNFGSVAVTLRWELGGKAFERVLQPDDSAFVKPHVPHSFSPAGPGKMELLSLRIGGKTMGEAQRELAHIGAKNLRRVYDEHTLWYREEKK